VHLKIDTGMARLGIRPGPELEHFCDELARTPGVALTGLMTHFACADEPDDAYTREQLRRFEEAREALRARGHDPALIHVANSAGLVRFPEARFGLVRPGIALYGLSPSSTIPIAGLRPVLSLRSRVVALREVAAGESVSYGALFRAARRTRVATVPVGYADGYTRRLSGRSEVLVRGRRCRMIGAITMDMCLIDVTDLDACVLGDEVVMLGAQRGDQGHDHISADELAERSDTISWEILANIGKRVPRSYIGERP
jgi:alanine racemase